MAKTKLRKLKEKADELVKQIVRLRDDWTCQRCDKYLIHDIPDQRKNIHTAHIVPKSERNALRWNLLNTALLCFHCHQQSHIRADLQWFRNRFPARWEYLHQDVLVDGVIKPRHRHIKQYRVADMKYLISQLEAKLKQLKGEIELGSSKA